MPGNEAGLQVQPGRTRSVFSVVEGGRGGGGDNVREFWEELGEIGEFVLNRPREGESVS